ncbi:hypothetical protein ATANTOWER_020545, partial [Ataeniobius toweri]|nr:hypothetical protein [Ataeniobius toweri]
TMDVLISLNNGKTFISSAYTITASTCSDGSVVVIVILVLLALVALALMWWFWPLCCTVVSLADLLVTHTPIFGQPLWLVYAHKLTARSRASAPPQYKQPACLAADVFVLVERAAVAFHRGRRQKRRAMCGLLIFKPPVCQASAVAMRPLFLCLYPHGLMPGE